MERQFRVSVRELVAFSCFAPDIMPAADQEALLTGTQAHKARQQQSEGAIEQTIRHEYEYQGVKLLVHGRMDAWVDGDEPFIEEIKHCFQAPEQVRAEHRAQAMCYAAMLASEKNVSAVRFSVCYVNLAGEVLREFQERLDAAMLKIQMDELLLPYFRFVIREAKHREQRDHSLEELVFPFNAYRKGQRELAVQVYTAIQRRKRLFASLPTGTGKSAAVLFPALKALGRAETERVVYLTARNTARQSPVNALRRMLDMGMKARCTVLTAKEKMCPAVTRCHPDFCSRAKGHFLRQGDAIEYLLSSGQLLWDEVLICDTADRYHVCPFELALALSEIADVLMMDLNYAFDPFAQVKRLFQGRRNFTLLVDEAHHAVERVRESLSGQLCSQELASIRTEYGKNYGRKSGVYRALSQLIASLRKLESDNGRLAALPDHVALSTQEVLNEAVQALSHSHAGAQELIRMCLPFLYAYEHLDVDYAILLEKHGRERQLSLYCLLPGKEIARITKGLRGTVFFSATLHPLPALKQLLGGVNEDACFSLPSPFPQENLAVIRKKIDTRFTQREHTAPAIAAAIEDLLRIHPGNTIVYFPSYAYLGLVLAQLQPERLPRMWIQTREMGEEEREAFLEAFGQQHEPILGLCVLGGLFSEGIDLPGESLVNVAVVGVGQPVPSVQLEAVQECYQKHFGDGFFYACRIPGMQKVQQAAGRVIRSETDKGMVLLMDQRYFHSEYEQLFPHEWRVWNEDLAQAAFSLER